MKIKAIVEFEAGLESNFMVDGLKGDLLSLGYKELTVTNISADKKEYIWPDKKYPDRYFDYETDEEFLKSEINDHPTWYKLEYDDNENQIGVNISDGYWSKSEYDKDGNLIYYETSLGEIRNNRI